MARSERRRALKFVAGEKLAGKYVLVRKLAVGGMGQIWVARNTLTNAEVALKILRGDADEKMQAELRFRHEAHLGAMLSHRNIVRVFDLIEQDDGGLVLVLELLRGETLFDRMSGKPLPTTEAVAIIMPILSALEHAHEMGVIHRDLKPPNIFLAVDPDGQVTPKLLDFGIAKLPMAGVQTLEGDVLGTPSYMSPEQIRADRAIDGRSDLFTVGVLLIQMLTGISPFAAGTASASLAAVLELTLDPYPEIDPKLWLVLQRAVAKRAYERFATAGEFAKALREAVPDSDAALASTMRREKPRQRSSVDSIPDQSVRVVHPRVANKKAWLVGGVVGGALLVGAVAATREKAPTSNVVVSPPPSPAPVSEIFTSPAPIAASPSAERSPIAPLESATTHSSGVKPRTAPKKKPVATTPGF